MARWNAHSKTDWVEFYSTVELKEEEDPLVSTLIEEWLFFYNWHRPHSSLSGKTPIERCCELTEAVPLQEEVEARYALKRERAQTGNFFAD